MGRLHESERCTAKALAVSELGLLRSGKDLVTANAQPLDVRLAWLDLRAIAKGGPASPE
jgi:hypothetical protein